MRKKEINLKLPLLCMVVCCMLSGLFLSMTTNAQAPSSPSDCKVGCTSNDVQIKSSYLSDASGNKLSSSFICPQSGIASVYLTLELTTNTPRVGVVIYAKIKKVNPPIPPGTIGDSITTISQCFGIALNQPTNKVTFSSPFNWQCGTPIAMTDVFIGWGTGNTNFCTGSGFQCPATSSKCNSLPPGQFIAIQIPSSQNANEILCSTQPGGTTAVFRLDTITVTTASGVTINWWENYTSNVLSNCIPTSSLTAYTSASKTVYAKVKNSSDSSAYSVAAVTLTVVPKPVTLSLTGSSICSGNPGTGTVSSSGSEVGVSYQLQNGANTNVQSAKSGTGSGLTWTGLAAGTGYHVVATGGGTTACPGGSNSVDVISVSNPVDLVLTGSSICTGNPNTGTVSSSTSQSGVSYQLKDGSNANVQSAKTGTGTGLTWSSLAAGTGYHVVATGPGTTACGGGSNSVNVSSVSNPSAPSVTYNAPACDQATFSITITGVISGASYSVKDKNGAAIPGISPASPAVAANTNNITFSNIPAGSGYQVTVTNNGCASSANSCGNAQVTARITQAEVIPQTSGATVKAYPNPFSDRIKFVVTSPIAGRGNLEVYNMMGQRVKTVYQGFIAVGTQTFELNMPTKQISDMIYVLRIGDKKVSGKILQINQ